MKLNIELSTKPSFDVWPCKYIFLSIFPINPFVANENIYKLENQISNCKCFISLPECFAWIFVRNETVLTEKNGEFNVPKFCFTIEICIS